MSTLAKCTRPPLGFQTLPHFRHGIYFETSRLFIRSHILYFPTQAVLRVTGYYRAVFLCLQ